ncbi:MAG: PQQ-binding-like beta-propeller repeat protein [Verrucomicrobiota bacterium]
MANVFSLRRPNRLVPIAPASIAFTVLLTLCSVSQADNWPQWRGPAGTSVTQETDLPLVWSSESNVRWKVELPERGNSTPIIWGDRVFVTQAKGSERLLLCFSRKDGSLLWQAGTTSTVPEQFHHTNSPCAASPVTDGERVIAYFGSAGMFAYDLQGKELWHVNLGLMDHQWGYAASPVLDEERCFVHFGPGSTHYIAAFDKRTGTKIWNYEIPRIHPAERTDGFAGKQGEIGSWSTPILLQTKDRTDLVVSLPGRLVGLAPATGEEYWTCNGLNPLLYTSPMAGEDIIVGSGGYGGNTIAVPSGGSGDMTSKRLWQKVKDKQRIGSGVISNGHLYILNSPGTAQCINLKSGEPIWEQRLTGPSGRSESWASMVLSGDRIYINNQAGDVFVLKAFPTYELLATNSLNDGTMNASVAVSDGDLFLRTEKHLWCIRKP